MLLNVFLTSKAFLCKGFSRSRADNRVTPTKCDEDYSEAWNTEEPLLVGLKASSLLESCGRLTEKAVYNSPIPMQPIFPC